MKVDVVAGFDQVVLVSLGEVGGGLALLGEFKFVAKWWWERVFVVDVEVRLFSFVDIIFDYDALVFLQELFF